MNWSVDVAHSQVGFSVKHMMFATVRGRFTKWMAEATYDPADISKTAAKAVIEAVSIDTGVSDRDNHLRSADFLNAEQYPHLTFVTKSVAPKEGGAVVVGDLTIRGVTKEVTLDVAVTHLGKDPWGNQRVGAHVTTSINRKDFGLTWNQAIEAGGVLVGEQVHIEIDVQLVGQAAEQGAAE